MESRIQFRGATKDGGDLQEFRFKIEWAEFGLRKRIINCLLTLLSISTVFALVMIALMAAGQAGPATLVIGALMAATVGCIGKLLNNSLKSVFRSRK